MWKVGIMCKSEIDQLSLDMVEVHHLEKIIFAVLLIQRCRKVHSLLVKYKVYSILNNLPTEQCLNTTNRPQKHSPTVENHAFISAEIQPASVSHIVMLLYA